MRKVHVLYYSWYDELADEWYHTVRAFGSKQVAERFVSYVKHNYPNSEVELVTCVIE